MSKATTGVAIPLGGSGERNPDGGRRKVTLIPGDGRRAGIVQAARRVLDAAGADIEWEVVLAGDAAWRAIRSGLPCEALDSILHNGLVLKGPLGSGGAGAGSQERLLRQSLEAFAHLLRVRHQPGTPSRAGWGEFDFLLLRNGLREREPSVERPLPRGEDPASQSPDVCYEERTVGIALDLARLEGRARIGCAALPGDRYSAMRERAVEWLAGADPSMSVQLVHPFLLAQTMAIDPARLDVVISTGGADDVVLELAIRLAGGGAAVPSIWYGPEVAIFEAAVQSLRGNGGDDRYPTGVFLAATALLRHVGNHRSAARVERALISVLRTRGAVDPAWEIPEKFADAMIRWIEDGDEGPVGSNLPGRARRWRPVVPSKRITDSGRAPDREDIMSNDRGWGSGRGNAIRREPSSRQVGE